MSSRFQFVAVAAVSLVASSGCGMVPRSQLVACQTYSCQLQRRNQEICAQLQNLRTQNQELANKALDAEEQLARYEKRAGEWDEERNKLQSLYSSAVEGRGASLPRSVRYRLEDFAERYPEYVEVDAESGISKFKSNVLFGKGQAELLPDAQAVLSEFASIFQDPAGKSLRIMVVGHTDETPIVKSTTRQAHQTNWHLSAHRAIAVEEYLAAAGIEPRRIGIVGYGPYQPLSRGRQEKDLAQNRRVEIYVLAPDAPIVGRTDQAGTY